MAGLISGIAYPEEVGEFHAYALHVEFVAGHRESFELEEPTDSTREGHIRLLTQKSDRVVHQHIHHLSAHEPNYLSLSRAALFRGVHEPVLLLYQQVIMLNGNLAETQTYSDWAWTENASVPLTPGPHVVTLCFIGNAVVRDIVSLCNVFTKSPANKLEKTHQFSSSKPIIATTPSILWNYKRRVEVFM